MVGAIQFILLVWKLRCHSNVIISDLPVVSKRHFRIYSVVFEKNHIRKIQPLIYCEDLESTNGTYVNDVCIGMLGRERAGHLLSHGDVIEVRPSCRFRLVQAFQNECKDHGRLEDIEYFRDRYAISDRLLGKGNYGAVFLASDASTSKQLACKIINVKRALYELGKTQPSLNPRRGAISSAGMDVVMREIRILADLDHVSLAMASSFCAYSPSRTLSLLERRFIHMTRCKNLSISCTAVTSRSVGTHS